MDQDPSSEPVRSRAELAPPSEDRRPSHAIDDPVSARVTLPPPSNEQRAVIDAVLDGHCVTVPSVAGSGKTTVMLQVASCIPVHLRALIVTYNRSLKDACCARIKACGLEGRVSCYTIHGIVSRMAGRVCNDDSKLNDVVREWDRGEISKDARPFPVDLVLLDEAQDLRPSFHAALCHVLRLCSAFKVGSGFGFDSGEALASSSRGSFGVDGEGGPPSLQMCLVGDPKQMLYDFPTYGSDRASVRYMEEPKKYWGEFTGLRVWVQRKLSVSYRLTPNIAAFVNVVWGTTIQGGNVRSENRPVEYICKYPYPSKYEDEEQRYLSTDYLRTIIDEYGAENVMFLAHSVKSENCPIRVHVNELMKETDSDGRRYNFHVKESIRGFEGKADVRNKVRVWTFCGSKGCEADAVVIFGFDGGWLASLNQMGVALSRARKRLVVIHGQKFEGNILHSLPYYPMLGDSEHGLNHSIAFNGQSIKVDVPPCKNGDKATITKRSELTQQVLWALKSNKMLVCAKNTSLPVACETKKQENEMVPVVYAASEFNYFAAVEQKYFLSYGTWTQDSGVKNRIEYKVNVTFDRTTEDVSALYGEALVYSLQWELQGYCPNIETVVNDGILRFDLSRRYYEDKLWKYIFKEKQCEFLPRKTDAAFRDALQNGIKGKDLIRLLNTRISIKKKRENRDGRIIFFRVKALEDKNGDDDENMKPFQAQIRSVYEATEKSAAQWLFLANAVMAHNQYHDKWNQVGTDPASYSKWVESDALFTGLSRLKKLMQEVPSSRGSLSEEENDGNLCSDFEYELMYEFSDDDHIYRPPNTQQVVGVQGICDWVGLGLKNPRGVALDLLEIKFISELGNENRLQVLTYCALRSIETKKSCVGMLYNARTGEMETCEIETGKAEKFLLDIAQFKYDGTKRQTEVGGAVKTQEIKTEPQDQTRSSSGFVQKDGNIDSEVDFENALLSIDLEQQLRNRQSNAECNGEPWRKRKCTLNLAKRRQSCTVQNPCSAAQSTDDIAVAESLVNLSQIPAQGQRKPKVIDLTIDSSDDDS